MTEQSIDMLVKEINRLRKEIERLKAELQARYENDYPLSSTRTRASQAMPGKSETET